MKIAIKILLLMLNFLIRRKLEILHKLVGAKACIISDLTKPDIVVGTPALDCKDLIAKKRNFQQIPVINIGTNNKKFKLSSLTKGYYEMVLSATANDAIASEVIVTEIVNVNGYVSTYTYVVTMKDIVSSLTMPIVSVNETNDKSSFCNAEEVTIWVSLPLKVVCNVIFIPMVEKE